jgi:hypothetical protein
MRFNFRLKIGTLTLFFMLSQTQTLEGVASKVGRDEHMILWDMEGCTLDQATETLATVQYKHRLGDIFLVSDAEGSYRGWCFSRRPWKEYLTILLDTEYLCYNFFHWTVRRGQATLRTSSKLGRPHQRVVAFLSGYEQTAVPQTLTHVLYDTGFEKRGVTVKVG